MVVAVGASMMTAPAAVSQVTVNASAAVNDDAPSWGMDVLDRRTDGVLTRPSDGQGVHVYVLDTAVANHPDISHSLSGGVNLHEDPLTSSDGCYSHGTHITSIIAGQRYGIAPAATIHPVRVMGCTTGGSTIELDDGLRWVMTHHAELGYPPAVVNLSLIARGTSAVVTQLLAAAAAQGLIIVAGAGNTNDDACKFTPADSPDTFTVGAATENNTAASFSNYGSCVTAYAPGELVTAADSSTSANRLGSGTSQASAHAAGVFAAAWGANLTASRQTILTTVTSWLRKNTITTSSGQHPLVSFPDAATAATAPAAVQQLRIKKVVKRKAKLTWTKTTAATNYLVTVKKPKRLAREPVTVKRPKIKLKKLQPRTRYVVTVHAANSYGTSKKTTVKFRTRCGSCKATPLS